MGVSAGIRTMAGAALAVVLSLAAYGYAFARPADDARIQATGWSAQPALSGEFANCPAGRRAVGGGVIRAGSRAIYLAASGPLDGSGAGGPLNPSGSVASTKDGDVARRWYAGVSNHASSSARVKVLALCSAASDATVQATPFSVAGRKTGHATARCPAGRRALGGGLVQSGWPDDRILASGPRDASGAIGQTGDGDVAREWYAVVHNLPAHRVRFKVFALCSADSHATIEATRFEVAGGRTGGASARCPASRRVVGGGLVPEGPPKFLREKASAPLDSSGSVAGTRDGDVARRWRASVENRNPGRVGFKVLAICEPG